MDLGGKPISNIARMERYFECGFALAHFNRTWTELQSKLKQLQTVALFLLKGNILS
jgi:hypothetical protein